MLNKCRSTIFMLFILIPAWLSGGAFVQEKGKSFVSLEYWTYTTAQFFNVHGHKQPANNHFDKREWNLYMEYGITAKDTLTAKSMYANITQTTTQNVEGFEDFEVSLRHQICKLKDKHYFAFEAIAIIPSGAVNDLSLHYNRSAIQPYFLYSRSFERPKKHYGFFDVGSGYRFYEGFPSDQIRAHMTLGYDIFTRFQLIGSAFLEYGVFNGENVPGATAEILYNPNYRLLKLDLMGRYRFYDNFSAVFGYTNYVWGENVGTNGGFHGGFWVTF